MLFRQRTIHRLTGLFVRWGLLEHPYGREYAKERYSLTGRRVSQSAAASEQGHSRARMGVIVAALLFASLLATGVLFSL